MTDVLRLRDQQRLLMLAVRRGEMVFVTDLARYLGQHPHIVKRCAKRNGWLKQIRMGHGRAKVGYMTALSAMKVIAHVRSEQGSVYLAGRDFYKEQEKRRASGKRYAATRL